MVKNVNGGKHKNQARKHLNNHEKKLRLKKEEDEMYACVTVKPGGNKLIVLCLDNVTRLCTIPGKFINKRRDNTIEKGTWILIGLRNWETAKERENCDLLEVYNDNEKMKLQNTINENWGIFTPKETVKEDIVFTNEYDEQQEKIHNEIIKSTNPITLNQSVINIDDI